ncbi:hypothetical protein [Mesorhizobium sp. M1E.F.Ca.ET.045.02.1.1]|uniref:hypothetical protein n=1 Tax=Mesorhizobium sp. M1E.F.Ca.ET.045.02.1.1 TaxID=2493672 RepID=UPI001671E163|nr:hypothetical protein [Mesorhizobium sp. M1E.F.Ca.ET.045.02.1.1]
MMPQKALQFVVQKLAVMMHTITQSARMRKRSSRASLRDNRLDQPAGNLALRTRFSSGEARGNIMARGKTEYETGARKYPARTGPDPTDDFSQDAAANERPAGGLTRATGETEDKTRQTEGQNPPGRTAPRPAIEKTSGAGPAISESLKGQNRVASLMPMSRTRAPGYQSWRLDARH